MKNKLLFTLLTCSMVFVLPGALRGMEHDDGEQPKKEREKEQEFIDKEESEECPDEKNNEQRKRQRQERIDKEEREKYPDKEKDPRKKRKINADSFFCEDCNYSQPQQIMDEKIAMGRALIYALSKDDTNLAWTLLKNHEPNVAIQLGDGRQAVHLAASIGNVALLKKLIKRGANFEACDNAGWRPLHCAAFNGNVACLSFLLAKGACASAVTKKGADYMYFALCGAMERALKSLDLEKEVDCFHNMLKALLYHGAPFSLNAKPGQTFVDLFFNLIDKTNHHQGMPRRKDREIGYKYVRSFLDIIELYSMNFSTGDLRSLSQGNPLPYLANNWLLTELGLCMYGLTPSDCVGSQFNVDLEIKKNHYRTTVAIFLNWLNDADNISIYSMVSKSGPDYLPLDELHCKVLFDLAASHNKLNTMQQIKDKSSIPLAKEMYQSAFVRASAQGHIAILNWIYEQAIDGELKDDQGWVSALNRALHLAAVRGHEKVVTFILHLGVLHNLTLDIRTPGEVLYVLKNNGGLTENAQVTFDILRAYMKNRLSSDIILRHNTHYRENNPAQIDPNTGHAAYRLPQNLIEFDPEILQNIERVGLLGFFKH